MGNAFTWFPSFTETLEIVPDDVRADFVWAIIQYGTNGIEPDFDSWELSALFTAIRKDIDNSVTARTQNAGGRPRKSGKADGKKAETKENECESKENKDETRENREKEPKKEEEKKPNSDSKTPETPVFEEKNPGYETSKPLLNQTSLNQDKLNQSNSSSYAGKPGEDSDGKAKRDGEIAEVVDYINAKTGKRLRVKAKVNREPINARLDEGYTVADLKSVVDIKLADWADETSSDGRRLSDYLVPETLFRPKNIERYLNSRPVPKARSEPVYLTGTAEGDAEVAAWLKGGRR